MSKIIQNGVQILEDNVNICVISNHRHDFQGYRFKDGTNICVDGGKEYIRRVGDLKAEGDKWKDISLSSEDNISKIREFLVWGTRGQSGKEPLKYRFIKDLELSHLQNLIKYINERPAMFPEIHKKVINYWFKQKDRKNYENR